MSISFNKFFGDREHTFALTDDMIAELERLTGEGIGAIYSRAVTGGFSLGTLKEIIRLGLIGGGASTEHAKRLTDTYATDRAIAEILPLALDVLQARWGEAEE